MFSLQRDAVEGRRIYGVDNNGWDIPELRKLLEEVLPQNRAFDNFELEYAVASGAKRRLLLNARQIAGSDRRPPLILLAIDEVKAEG